MSARSACLPDAMCFIYKQNEEAQLAEGDVKWHASIGGDMAKVLEIEGVNFRGADFIRTRFTNGRLMSPAMASSASPLSIPLLGLAVSSGCRHLYRLTTISFPCRDNLVRRTKYTACKRSVDGSCNVQHIIRHVIEYPAEVDGQERDGNLPI
ncbi:hypothetical protein CBL_11021 [Carabus blaptoides fortunei]